MVMPTKPAAIKRLQGNPGKRKIPGELETARLARVPPAPDFLDDEGRRAWHRFGRLFVGAGLLTVLDIPALTLLCVAWGHWVAAERKLAERGDVVRTPAGQEVQNVWHQVDRHWLDEVAIWIREFGGTPVARTRVALAEAGPDIDLAELLFGSKVGSKRVVVGPPASTDEDLDEWLS